MPSTVPDGLRGQLLDGLPARVQGMAEALVEEWSQAVEAVPQLATVATSEIIALLRLDPPAREAVLRSRWGEGVDHVSLAGWVLSRRHTLGRPATG